MTNLRDRFKALDQLPTPDLWYEIEERAMAAQPTTRRSGAWVLIAITLLLALAIGGAAVIGSGIVKLPPTVDATASPPSPTPPSPTPPSPSPSASASASVAASATPAPSGAASWIATGTMSLARSGHTATLLSDGKVLVAAGGGSGVSGLLDTAELYDPASGSWTATGAMNGKRILHTATLLPGGKVLVTGGADGISETSVHALASAELYDPETGTWSATGSMMEARARHSATLLADGRVLVTGGSGSGSGTDSLASAELYDPATGSWSATSAMLEARSEQTATLLPDGRVLVAGGNSSSGPQLASAELYDPGTGSWTATGAMVTGVAGHLATGLPDGRVLVLGGSTSSGPGGLAEVYDPSTGSWTAAADLNGEHAGATATLLQDGSVLLAGGSGSSGGGSSGGGSEERFDPATGAWVATPGMLEGRADHTATLLDDGRVLVTGGVSAGGMLASAELFEPGSGN